MEASSSLRPVVVDLGDAGSFAGNWLQSHQHSPTSWFQPALYLGILIGHSVYTQSQLLCLHSPHTGDSRLSAALLSPGKMVFIMKGMKVGGTPPSLLQWIGSLGSFRDNLTCH